MDDFTVVVMSSQPSPHDAVFRRILGEPANAACELRAVLPAALSDNLDLDNMSLAPGSFVDPQLQWRHSDLLFNAPWRDGGEAFVYVLVEHQSSTDQFMPYRMLSYLMRIWDMHRKEHPDAARSMTPQALLTLLLFQAAPSNTRLADDLRRWASELSALLQQPGGLDDFIALVTYIENVGEAPADELHDLFTELGPTAKEAYMTTADMLRAEGEASGLERGEARGRAEGEARGRAETLAQLLRHKFGPLPETTRDRLDNASIEQLTTWTNRALIAKTLDDVIY